MAATTRLPALAARAAIYGATASSRPPRARPSGPASMSWSSTSRGGTGARFHEEVGAGARRTHALALARRERGRETTGEPSAHALPRRTRACALARRTRALALARRALALARGRAAFRDGREGCFLPGGRRPELAPRGTRLHTELVRAPYAFRPQSPAGARRGPRPVSVRGRVHGGHRATCSWRRRWTWACRGVREQLAALSETPSPAGSPSPSQSPSFGGYAIDVVHDEKSCIVAPRFVVAEDGGVPQPMRDYAEIKNMLATCVGMREGVRARARCGAFASLAEGEAEVHGMDVEEVHFHEVGAVDSVVISLRRAALDYLQWRRWQISPLPMGRGVVRGAAHGPLPSPPPAVLSCLCGSGVETHDAGADGEFVTPTGACIVAALGTAGRSARGGRRRSRPQNRVRRRDEIVARPAQPAAACARRCRFRARRPPV